MPQHPLDPESWQRRGRDLVREAQATLDDIAFDPALFARLGLAGAGVAAAYRGHARAQLTVGAAADDARLAVDLTGVTGGVLAAPVSSHLVFTAGPSGSHVRAELSGGDPRGDLDLGVLEGDVLMTVDRWLDESEAVWSALITARWTLPPPRWSRCWRFSVEPSDPGGYTEDQLFGFFLGGDPTGEPSSQTRDAVAGAGARLISSKLGRQITKVLPVKVDALSCEPAPSATTATSGSCTVGKWLSQRLFIAYRQHLQPRPDENTGDVQRQFRMGDKLLLEGTGGDRGYYGADLLCGTAGSASAPSGRLGLRRFRKARHRALRRRAEFAALPGADLLCDGPVVRIPKLRFPIAMLLVACHAAAPQGPGAWPTEGQVPGDGASLFYRMVGDGPDVLVMIHGGPGMDMGYMVPDFAPLAERHRLLFYDQRGGGRSEHVRDDPALYTMERHVADLESLRKQFGLPRLTLVAHSFGPAIAASYAMAYPGRVARMIFLGPVPPRAGDFAQRYGATLDSRLTADERAEMAQLGDAMIHGPDPVAACRAYWAIGVRPRVASPELAGKVTGDFCGAGADAIRSGMGVAGPRTQESLGAWDFRPGLPKVTAPTLILHGETDAIPIDLVEEWPAAMPSAKLVKVPGASHFPYVERPELVWPEIERFLRATRP